MTFALGGGGGIGGDGCEECDECRYFPRRNSNNNPDRPASDDKGDEDSDRQQALLRVGGGGGDIPAAIASAVERHRKERRRAATAAGRRLEQTRTLRMRHGPCSVWEWNLPSPPPSSALWPGTVQPVLEFGNSHRIVWIQRCPGRLQSIGPKGIVGSYDEESTRPDLADWTAGRVAFVPSNGGQAVGYLHRALGGGAEGDEAPNEQGADLSPKHPSAAEGRYATLLIAKIPDQLIALKGGREDRAMDYNAMTNDNPLGLQTSAPSWLKPLLQICQQYVSETCQDRSPSASSRGAPLYTILDSDDAAAVKAALG
jgi:hypothetical protein